MFRTKSEMGSLTNKKLNSAKATDKIVSDELLKMGFSYAYIGTHYLHDSIVYAVAMRFESFSNVKTFCVEISEKVSFKYGVTVNQYNTECASAISKAFVDGNIDYILDIFKESYDRDRMSVTKKQFIMTLRNKILSETEEQRSYNTNQLRLIIQGTVERITDDRLLEGLCNIVLSMEGQVIA